MARRFTLEDDVFIIHHFSVGEVIATDLPQSWAAIQRRATLLKESGVWKAIIISDRYAWVAIRERELLSPTQALVDLDMLHPGSMIDAIHFNDLMGAKEYAKETEEWFSECKASIETIETEI